MNFVKAVHDGLLQKRFDVYHSEMQTILFFGSDYHSIVHEQLTGRPAWLNQSKEFCVRSEMRNSISNCLN